MKRQAAFSISALLGFLALAFITGFVLIGRGRSAPAGTGNEVLLSIGRTRLEPVGRVPSETQAARLREIANRVRHSARAGDEPSREQLAGQAGELEQYLRDFPDSPYNPSVRINLGQYYQARRQFQKALVHWDNAWKQLAEYDEGVGRELGDEAVVNLALRLLVLGRTSEVDALGATQRRRAVKPELATLWARIWEKRARVARMTADSYKCGIYAVDQVATRLVPGEYRRWDLLETPGTPEGFSLDRLASVAQQSGVPLTMVRLTPKSRLPVPCVVHLASEHYSAVLEERDGLYFTVDPGVEAPTWLSYDELMAEATGYLLVPSVRASFYAGVTSEEAARVIGRFSSCPPTDNADTACTCTACPCDCPPGLDSAQQAGPKEGVDDPGQGTGCKDCESIASVGMPRWRVSEPYLNVWIEDIPIRYVPTKGPPVELQLAYRDRYSYVSGPVFGNPWRSNFDSLASFSKFYPGGNSAIDLTDDGSGERSLPDPIHHVWSEKLYDTGANFIGVAVHFPNGAIQRFTGPSASYGRRISEQLLPDGTKLTYNYTGSPAVLTSITDADSGTTLVYYDDASWPTFITRVVTPDGATARFAYDGTGRLASITDAAGLLSTFDYHSSETFTLADMVTPYGTTAFDRSTVAGIADRTVVVTRPDGSKEAFALIDDASVNGFPTSFSTHPQPLPTSLPYADGSHPYAGLDVAARHRRNSFHWNAQQLASMSGFDVTNPTAAEMKRARIRHWLANVSENDYSHVSSFLGHVQDRSPDGTTEGAITWFDHWGKNPADAAIQGTNALPRTVARVMATGTPSPVPTTYSYHEYNLGGRKTLQVERWLDASDTARFRTNRWVFATNYVDMLQHFGPGEVLRDQFAYNTNHQVTAYTNAVGDVTTFTYDSVRRLSSVVSPTAHVSTNYFSASGLILTNVHLMGTNAYSTNVTERVLAGAYVRTSLNSGTLTNYVTWSIHTDERGLAVTSIADELGRVIERRYPGASGNVEKWHHELFPGQTNATGSGGRLILDPTAYIDRLGNTNRLAYDTLRRLAWTANPLLVTNTFGYCDCGAVKTQTNAWLKSEQEVTEHGYNDAGWRWRTVYPGGAAVTNYHDLFGRLQIVADVVGSSTNVYDRLGRLTEVRNAGGLAQRIQYDNDDWVRERTDYNGITVTNTYDLLGRLQTRQTPDVGPGTERTTYTYSPQGLTMTVQQIDASTTRTNWFAYDAAGRKVGETNANLEVVTFTYAPAGDLLTLSDGRRTNVTEWAYDTYGRVISKKYANGSTNLVYGYDALGRLTNRWSQAKGTNSYAYDAAGNLTNINYKISPDVGYAYDALNRVKTMVDAAGTTAFTYANGLLATESSPWTSAVVTYSYNNARLRSSLSLSQPGGGTFTNVYAYDAAHRLTNVTSQAGSFGYLYANAGASPARLVQKQTIPATTGSLYITNTFDAAGRMLSTALMSSLSNTVNQHSYTLNAGNQRTSMTRDAMENGNYDHITTYGYDKIGQLRTANAANLTGGGAQTIEQMGYGYDASWNLGQRTNNGTVTVFTNNVLNQIVKVGASSLSHDSNGNLISNGGTGISYTYDDENQLVTAEVPSLWKTECVYDGMRRLRIRKEFGWLSGAWYPSTETRYIYDGMRVIQERNSSNQPQVSYTRGNDLSGSLEVAGGIGGLLSRSTHAASSPYAVNSSAHYHADGNGNIVYLIKPDHTRGAEYRYDPFGKTLSSDGTLATANVYRFSSKEFLANSGLYYYGYRFYDPVIQRWMNRDPSDELGGVNLYQFVNNVPIGFRDSFGLYPDHDSHSQCIDYAIQDYMSCLKTPYSIACSVPQIWGIGKDAMKAAKRVCGGGGGAGLIRTFVCAVIVSKLFGPYVAAVPKIGATAALGLGAGCTINFAFNLGVCDSIYGKAPPPNRWVPGPKY